MVNPKAAERAALAFSAIPSRAAMRLSNRLSTTERMQLREALTRIRGAHDVPSVTHSRTRRYAGDLEGVLRRMERRVR